MAKAPYTVEVEVSAAKVLAKIQNPLRGRLLAKMRSLSHDPRPHDVTKLTGLNAYRVRVGDHRIVYTVEDSIHVVAVIRISHRSTAYKDRT